MVNFVPLYKKIQMTNDKPVKAWKVPLGKVSLASWIIIIVEIDGDGTKGLDYALAISKQHKKNR